MKVTTVKKGSKGEAVKQLQMLLGITVDGIFGPKTKAAVVAYQTAHNLEPDGICGPKTWAAIDQAMKDKDSQPAQKTYTVTIKGLSLDEAYSLVMKYPDAVASPEGSVAR